jgi:hypothetical protein
MAIHFGLRHFALAAAAIAFATAAEAAVSASPAASLGPEAALVEPSGGFVGRLALEPQKGRIGTPVTVTGSGLPADKTFDLVWHTSTARWKVADAEYHGREYTPVGYVVAKVTTDGAGAFSASFDTPDDFGFWHDITVQDSDRVVTQAAFYVEMTVDISPKSGPVGTPITVDVKGIGSQQLQNSWLLLYDNKYTGWMSSVNTGGSAHFTIPAVGQPGTHVLEVLHGDFTFPYRNMQQSPEPDRPTFPFRSRSRKAIPCFRRRRRCRRRPACVGCLRRAISSPSRNSPEWVSRSRSAVRASRRARATSSTGRRSPATASAAAAGRKATA